MTVELLRSPAHAPTLFAREFADRIEARLARGVDLVDQANFNRLSRPQQDIFLRFTLSAVTFDFRFFIEEANRNSASTIFSHPILAGAFSLNAGLSANFGRETEKRFQITNTFYALHSLDYQECQSIVARSENVVYPITGVIGIEKTFREFISIDLMRTQWSEETKYSDRLAFVTEFSANANPSVDLKPVLTNRLELSSVTSAFGATRRDTHAVTLNIVKGQLATAKNIMAEINRARDVAAAISLANANATRLENLVIINRDLLAGPLR